MKKSLTPEQILKWNKLKQKLTLVELLNIGIDTCGVWWDEDKVISTDCMNTGLLSLVEMDSDNKVWLGNICRHLDHFENVQKIWTSLIASQETKPSSLLRFWKSIKEQYRNKLTKEDYEQYRKDIATFLEGKVCDEISSLQEFLLYEAHNVIVLSDKQTVALYDQYHELVNDADELGGFLLNADRDHLKEIGILDKLLVKLLSFKKGPYRMLEPALDSEAAYPLAVEWILEKKAHILTMFPCGYIQYILSKLKDEDRKKVEALVSPGLLEAGNVFEEFRKAATSAVEIKV